MFMVSLNREGKLFDFLCVFDNFVEVIVGHRRYLSIFGFHHYINFRAKSDNPDFNILSLKLHSLYLISDSFLYCLQASFALKDSIHTTTNVYTVKNSLLFAIFPIFGNVFFST